MPPIISFDLSVNGWHAVQMPEPLANPSDIVGRRFGRLVVAELVQVLPYVYGRTVKKSRRIYRYRCVCDCGVSSKQATRTSLLSGHTASCGCEWYKTGSNSIRWTGHGELSGWYWSRVVGRSRRKGTLPEITIEDAWVQFLKQGKRCALTGVLLTFGSDMTASLDRIDSSKSYVQGNVQWLHKDVNKMKWNLSDARFIEVCKLVVKHAKGRKI